MTLAEYLEHHTATEVADKCQCAVSTITRIAAGVIAPRLSTIQRIVAATDGLVGFDTFFPIEARHRPQPPVTTAVAAEG